METVQQTITAVGNTLLPIVGSGLFVLVSWISWQVYIYRKQKARDELILKEIISLRNEVNTIKEQTPYPFTVTLNNPIRGDKDSDTSDISVSAPTLKDVEALLSRWSPAVAINRTSHKSHRKEGKEYIQ